MAKAQTAAFHRIALQVEDDPAGSGTFSIICGLTARTFTRENNMDENEVPDCLDESKPLEIERNVRSSNYAVSGSGVYAKDSHKMLLDWMKTGITKLVRIEYLDADTLDDVQYEEGNAYLVSINNTGEKGSNYTAELELQFNGTPATLLHPGP